MENLKKKLILILSFLFILFIIIAAVSMAENYYEDIESKDSFEALEPSPSLSSSPEPTMVPADEPTEASTAAGGNPSEVSETAPDSTSEPVRVPNPYAESFLANEDMAAWISIPGTNIDYPVMWTPRDEQYYLYRGFDGSSNKNGCLILDTDSCLDPLTTNLIIHGHNMKSGAMFGNLTDYEDEDYYKGHREIILYTEECERHYEILAVFRSQVYRKTDEVFKFYKFFQADTEEEFEDFYQNIKTLSEYDTGVTAAFGDNFITLSTCVYHVEQGRFVVVAKEIESGDYYEPVR